MQLLAQTPLVQCQATLARACGTLGQQSIRLELQAVCVITEDVSVGTGVSCRRGGTAKLAP